MTNEEQADTQAELTNVAAKRVTWEAARNMANERAATHFVAFEEDIAKLFRDLAAEFEAKRKAASDEQDVLLKKLGRR